MTDDLNEQKDEKLETYLYDGEEIQERVDIGETQVAVTSHRVIAYSSTGKKKLQYADRPNVEDVRTVKRGNTAGLRRGVRFAIYGATAAVAGYLLRGLEFFDQISSVDTSSAPSVGESLEFANTIINTMKLAADAAFYAGLAVFV
ncbi:MAG: hypothetical protein SXQ77_07320, partial [Halobacteria archaeon]|nr:hypothetical protein [Halobacteria archaeon]